MKYLILFVFFLNTIIFPINTAFAYDVKYLDQNQPAPFAGYLFAPETEKVARLSLQELDYNKQLVISLEAINKSYSDQVTTMQSRIDNQTKELKEYKSENSFFSKYGMFLLGCLTTTAVAYSIHKIQ